jgi:hypothetical protein
MKPKKSQIMSMETIAVLIVFFIILMFVLIFYYSFKTSGLEQKQKEVYSQGAVKIAIEVANMPELECSGAGVELGVDCFDKLKIESLSKLIAGSIDLRAGPYLDKFGNSKIIIREIYSQGAMKETNWTLYSREPDNKKDEYVFQNLISISDPRINPPVGIRSIGVLETTFYSTE